MSSTKLSHLAETLIPSEIVRLGAVIKEKIKAGEHLYNYTVGDFDSSQFPIPEKLKENIIKAYNEGHTTYPAAEGDLELREAISVFIEKKLQLLYNPSEILIAAGGRPLIYACFRAIVDKHDKVIYPIPSWNNNHYVHFTEGEHIVLETERENNFMPTAKQIQPHIKGATLLALCSPLNPTGTTFSKEELEKICDLILEENKTRQPGEKKMYLMFDQIYWTLTHGETKHFNPVSLRPEMKEFTIFIDGISKAFAATGVRVGWSFGPKEVILKMRGINSHVGSWAPLAEQKAVAWFMQNETQTNEYLESFKKEIAYRLTELYSGFQRLKSKGYMVDAIVPEAAIYLTVKLALSGKKREDGSALNTQEEVTTYILDEAKLAMVPFSSFGTSKENEWYRLSVGCCKKEDIESLFEKMETALQKLS